MRVPTVTRVGVGDDEWPIVDDGGGLAIFFAHAHAREVLVLIGREQRPHQTRRFVRHLTERVTR
jgi:hypothetical protein